MTPSTRRVRERDDILVLHWAYKTREFIYRSTPDFEEPNEMAAAKKAAKKTVKKSTKTKKAAKKK